MNTPLITIGLILALGATGDNWEVFAVQAIGILIMLLGMANKNRGMKWIKLSK